MDEKRKKIVVAVSGGFDPLHIGHVRMFYEARALGDELVVILNNDNWLNKKKGYIFMKEDERKEILEAFTIIDQVVLTTHEENPEDMSVCSELRHIRPHIFVNGGDRKEDNVPEVMVCRQLGCDLVFNIGHGGKIQSSSQLVEKFLKSTK